MIEKMEMLMPDRKTAGGFPRMSPRQIALTPAAVAGLLVAATMTACAPKGTGPSTSGEFPVTQPGATLPADLATQPTTKSVTIGDVLPAAAATSGPSPVVTATMPVLPEVKPSATTAPVTMPVIPPVTQPVTMPTTLPSGTPATMPMIVPGTQPASSDVPKPVSKIIENPATPSAELPEKAKVDPAAEPQNHAGIAVTSVASTQPVVSVSGDGAVTVPALPRPSEWVATQPTTQPISTQAATTQAAISPTMGEPGNKPVMLDVVGGPKPLEPRRPDLAQLAADLQKGEESYGVVIDSAHAATHPAGETAHDAHHTPGEANPAHTDLSHGHLVAEPTVSTNARWAGVMVLVSLGMFLASAVIGPILRANTPAEPADDGHGGHDDHGHGGHDAHGH